MLRHLPLAAALCAVGSAASAYDEPTRILMTLLDRGCVAQAPEVAGILSAAGARPATAHAVLAQLEADGAIWWDGQGALHASDHLCHPGDPDRRSREVLIAVLRANRCALPAGSLDAVGAANNLRPSEVEAAAQFLVNNGYADRPGGGALSLHADACRG